MRPIFWRKEVKQMGSFNIDIALIMSYASTMFNNLVGVAAIGIGISLGVGILGLLIRVMRGALSGMG